MKTRNKIMLLALCMVALIAVSVLGTMAYLTSQDTVTNTFTVGKVAIKLDEAAVNADGTKKYKEDGETLADRVKSNTYKLMPGRSYTKDPTVTVLANSEESYVRMVVTATFDNALTDDTIAKNIDSIFEGYKETEWKRTSKTVSNDKKVITYVYDYKETVSTDDTEKALPALFTGIKIPGEWTKTELDAIGNFKIEIVAKAIQKDGFDNPEAAWKEFK